MYNSITVKVVIQHFYILIRLVSVTHFKSKATPTNDTDYSCHVKGIEFVQPNNMWSISCHITLLVINSLRGGHTHKHTNTHAHTHMHTHTGTHTHAHAHTHAHTHTHTCTHAHMHMHTQRLHGQKQF